MKLTNEILIINKLNNCINLYDKVIILDGCFGYYNEFVRFVSTGNVNGKIIVFTDKEFEASENVDISVLSDEEMKIVTDLYYLYEFSDKVVYVTESKLYGGLMNYIKQGLLSFNEIVEYL